MGQPPPPDYGPLRTKLLSQWCAFLQIMIYEALASTRQKAKGCASSRKIGNMPERVRIPLRPPSCFVQQNNLIKLCAHPLRLQARFALLHRMRLAKLCGVPTLRLVKRIPSRD